MVPAVGLQLLSPPCPPSILLSQTMPEMTEKTPLKKPHRKKNRETHNAVERHRKKKINAGINKIGELIPCSPALKQSKIMILDQAYKYITEMKRQNDELLLNGGNREQAEEIKKLRVQLDDIQKENARYIALLKANDICLYDDPTIHWKGNLKNAKVSVVIPSDQVQKKKGNLSNAKVSVVIPGDQVQKNIIVYSNGSQLGGNNQGTSVQGITFNISHNLPKQTANVVPVQRTCNLVTPVTLSGIYSTEIKSGVETSVPPLMPGLPNLPKKILEPSTSENEQRVLMATSAASSQNASEPAKMPPELQNSLQGEVAITKPKNGQESSRLLKETGGPNISLSSRADTDIPNTELAVVTSEEDSRSMSQKSCGASVPDPTCIPSTRLSVVDGFPPGSVCRSPHGRSGSGVPATSAVEAARAVTELNPLPATTLEKWPFPSSSAIGTPGSKNIGSLSRITSAGNTQTTWTTLQLAGNTVQPLSHAPSSVMAGLSNEPVHAAGATACVPNRCSATSASLSNPPPVDEQTPEQIVVTLPSCPALPMQPLVAKTQVLAQLAGSLLPLNPAMQVIQMAQPVGSAVAAPPANQNVIILQPPSAAPCPPVLRADVPSQAVSQQIVIIQTANQNPLSLFSAPPPPPPPVRVPVNGASPAGSASNPVPNASGPHTFGGKHLVHILPRPSSSPSSSSTQTFSVAVSNNQQLPQTVSLNGQLFALKPVKSCSGASDQAPMQIIQPTTSEDPNTNVALNTFGALAHLNQSISQMAGQSCLQLPVTQPANPTMASSQAAPSDRVLLAATPATPSSTAENSLLTSVSQPGDDSKPKPSGDLLSSLGPKRPSKKPSSKKCSAASVNLACRTNPCGKDAKKLDGGAVEAAPERPASGLLLENVPAGAALRSLALPPFSDRGAPNDASASESHPKERAEHCAVSAPAPDLNAAAGPRSSPPGQFTAVAPDPQDTVSPSLQTSRPQANNSATNSQLAEPSQCASTSPSAFSDLPTTTSQISGLPVTNNGAPVERILGAEASEDCRAGQDCSIAIQATDLLEGQGLTKMLSELSKEGDAVQKTFPVQVAHSDFSAQSAKPVIDSSDDLVGKQEELLLMSTEGGNLTPSHSCSSEPEGVVANRQTDSPMSTSSGSSCGFTVASMLPDTCRESVPSSTSVNTCNSCTFSEQTDIVALAARAIFDQETLAKGAVAQSAAPKGEDVASLGRETPFKSHTVKDAPQIETAPSSFGAQSSAQMNIDRSAEKQGCSLRVEMSSADLLASQSSSASSLSVNNLIHQSCIIHPPASCSGLPLSSDQATVSASGTPAMPAASYMSQSPGRSPALITEYTPEQLSALRTNAMQAPSQMREPHLKQPSQESRKDSAKRAVQDDHLLSAPKRQKQCSTAPLQLEGMALLNQEANNIANQTQILVGQIPTNSSNPAVSVSSQGHADIGHSRLFPAGNFVPPALRQAEVQCNPQVSVSDQPGQAGQQHLPPLQHAPAQGMTHLHSNHLYIKQQQQQQQAGQLRDRHHLYQLQHHIPHTETSLHSQAHSVHQQRVMHQEAQMQKKRSLIQAAQPTPLGLQQKHHGNEQARQKSGQPHPHHPQIQQMQQHFAPSQPEKSCENPAGTRTHHSHPQSHLNPDVLHQQQQQPDVGNRQPGSGVSSEHVGGHGQMQRLMTSRALEQQMVSQPSIVTRPSDMTCAPHRQERNRVSSYSAEALIGKSPSNSEQRIGLSIQSSRVPDQLEMRNYLDVSRNKGLAIHNMQGHMSIDHTVGSEVQRLSECQTFKPSGTNQQPGGNFEVQSSRNSDIGNSMPSLRGMQTQAFRIAQNAGPSIDRQKRLSYPPVQGISTGTPLPPSRDNDNTCHQSFMQSLLAPHLGDQSGGGQRLISEHQRNPQCGASSIIEYNCPPARENIHIRRDGEGQNRESCDMSLGAINNRSNSLNIPFSSSSSSGDIQGRNTSPSVSIQKTNPMRMTESHGGKGPMNTPVSSNVHGGVRPALPHPPVSRGNAEQVPPSVRQPNSSVTQRSRHPLQENGGSKIRQAERNRSGNQRHGNAFECVPHLPLPSSSSMILGRQQPTLEKRGGIVRFMPDGPQVSNDTAAPDQHSLSQNFGFPFIPEGGMNPPINANASFIPPVTQSSATRTPALIPVDPQNTLPSFYPPYSPAHPPLSNDISIPYFPNQMFPNPGTEKPNGGGLNNRFGSILSPPRPVGFAQPSFPLLTDMAPMHMANSSHLSNFNLTSLFPEIATALPPDGSAISPLLSIANTSASDSSKQPSNRPAHNISHILGHDCSSAV